MKPDSPVVITATLPKANGAEPETGLCRRAEYWQDRYHDLEASFYQVKAELTSVLERERSRLQKEGSGHSALARDQLCAARLLLEEREDTVQDLRRQLNCKEEEVNKLKEDLYGQTEQRRVAEAALANSRAKEELCEQLLDQLQTCKDTLRLKDEELQKLRTEIIEGQEFQHSVGCELRCLEAVLDKEARNSRMVDLLQAERDMWLCRSEHYERNYDSLRRSLCDLASQPEIVDISITSPTCPSVPESRRRFHHRRLCYRGARSVMSDR